MGREAAYTNNTIYGTLKEYSQCVSREEEWEISNEPKIYTNKVQKVKIWKSS